MSSDTSELKTSYSAQEITELLEKARSKRQQGPAKPLTISASKLKRIELCPRIWYAESVLYAYTESKATQAGKRIHAQLEDYYKKGMMISGAAATAARFYPLPESMASFRLEHPFTLVWAGAPLSGVIDLLALPGTLWHKQIQKNTIPRILDLKTSSNPDEFCIKQQQLPEDRQLLIYSKAAMEMLDAPLVEISQVQIRRSAPFPGRMLTPELVTQTMIAEAEAADCDNVLYMRQLRDDLPEMAEIATPETRFGRPLPCDNVFGKRCAYYETCHGAASAFSFANAAQKMDLRVTTESGLLSHMKAPTQEQTPMSGVTSQNASNAHSPAPEGGVWSVDPTKGSAVWEGLLGSAKITLRSKGQVAMISADGAPPEKLSVPADFPVDPTTGRGSVDAIRKHLLYPALERMRGNLGMPSMFAPQTAVATSAAGQKPAAAVDADVFAAMAAERQEAEQPPQHTPARADQGMALEELQALFPTIKPDHLAEWLAQGMNRQWLLTTTEEEFIRRMEALLGVGKAKARKRWEYLQQYRLAEVWKDVLEVGTRKRSEYLQQYRPGQQAAPAQSPVQVPVQPPVQQAAPAQSPVQVPVQPPVQQQQVTEQPFRLYIRCAPIEGEPTVMFEDLISPLLQGMQRPWHSIPAYELAKEIYAALGNLDDLYLRRKARGRAVIVSSPEAPLWRACSQGIIEYADSTVIGF